MSMSLLKPLLINNNFRTCRLVVWQHRLQPISGHVVNFVLTNMALFTVIQGSGSHVNFILLAARAHPLTP